jgi:hypothetical protein
MDGVDASQTLWAEDGCIFINQAREYGVSTLWKTYAGYLHLFPRIVSLFSCYFSLKATPLIFLSGWFLAYGSLIYISANRMFYHGLNKIDTCIVIVLMMAQPHSGEVFYSLTNAQWFIGGALALYLLVPIDNNINLYNIILLFIASLTGPFVLILFPILLTQIFIQKKYKERKVICLVVIISSIIQFAFISSSNRFIEGSIDKNFNHWITVIKAFLCFGTNTFMSNVASYIIWIVFLLGILIFFKKQINYEYNKNRNEFVIVIISAIFIFFVELLSVRENFKLLNPIGFGARYFFIPYLLIIFSSYFIILRFPKIKYILYISFVIISLTTFSFYHRNNLQYSSYAYFAEYKNDVIIPINPQNDSFPSWHIRLPNKESIENNNGLNQANEIDINNSKKLNIINNNNSDITYTSTSDKPQFFFNLSEQCHQDDHIGVEIVIDRQENGWAQLSWSKNMVFPGDKSTRRYYPSGCQMMHFSMPAKNVNYVRFDPMEKQGEFSIKSFNIFCLRDG